jgi:hypothetical protein
MPVFRRRRTHEDFSDEIQAHLDLEAERLVVEGMSPEAARAAALKTFGNVASVKERFYETSPWAPLEQCLQDLRYAWRWMRHSPSLLATVIVTLAVGLGLLTIAFTIFNAYVLRPFAIRDPDGLHQIVWHGRDGGGQGFRWRDYEELSRRTDLFSVVVGEHTRVVGSNGRPLMTAVVSLNYFDALAPALQLGRAFGAIDAHGAGSPAVLTHQAWTRLFNRDGSAIGRDIELNGHSFTIVGILGPAFTGLGDSPRDVFVPVTAWVVAPRAASRETRETEILVRLQSGVTSSQAEAALAPVMNRIIEHQDRVTAQVRPQSSPNAISTELLALLSPVFAAFILVLIAACANVSNMLLARAIARHREIAVRLSIGASRGRVVRQLLTEGLLIAALAGLTGLALAAAGLRVAMVALFSTLPPSVAPILRLVPMTFDARVFLFALAASTVATLLFALPALQASRPLLERCVTRATRCRATRVEDEERARDRAGRCRGRAGDHGGHHRAQRRRDRRAGPGVRHERRDVDQRPRRTGRAGAAVGRRVGDGSAGTVGRCDERQSAVQCSTDRGGRSNRCRRVGAHSLHVRLARVLSSSWASDCRRARFPD